uniref:Uncharacterized protein n=1 Tax=Triticum urartu TaxID=4572 RepID=A0A8R7V1V0_TRIUA
MRESKHGRWREPKLLPPACPLHGSSSPCDHIQPQLLQKDFNLLNPLAELEKQSQEKASRAVHQLIMDREIRGRMEGMATKLYSKGNNAGIPCCCYLSECIIMK